MQFPSRRHARRERGFSIIEILVSMMFLSLGIMGVIGFFFMGANDNREAIRTTRATMIARTVRDAMMNALRYPRAAPTPGGSPWYRFELPSVAQGSGTDVLTFNNTKVSGFYFNIDDGTSGAPMTNNASVLRPAPAPNAAWDSSTVLDLPSEAFDGGGTPLALETWPLRDTFIPFDPAAVEFDDDDSQFYSFRILVRRMRPRAGETTSTGFVTPGDVFECTLYVFRNYLDYAIPGFPKYDVTTGEGSFTDAGGRPIEECTPIVTYRFFISS